MDAETLEKSAKAGLVQVERQVSKNGRTFTQHFWIKPGDVKPTDRVLTQQPNAQPKAPAQPQGQSNTKTAMVSLLSSHGRDALMAHAKANGVAWKENANEGINWMRASMAIQKHMASNPGVWDAAKIGASGNDKSGQQSTQPDDKKQQDAQPTQPTQQDDSKPDKTPAKDDKTAPTPADKAAKTTPEAKKKVKELADNMGRDKLMETAKKNGITWNEHSNPAVNWMRASMAISAALTVDPDVLAADTVQADLKATQAQVKRLEDLVSQLQNPTAQQVAQQQAQAGVLSGLTTDMKSDREKKEFGADLAKATPEQFMRARTLGMVAGDDDAADYLERLYDQYVETMKAQFGPKVDPLQDKLQGVVNKQIVHLVQKSTANIRRRVKTQAFRASFLEPWVDPNGQTANRDWDAMYAKKDFRIVPGDMNQAFMIEKDGNHELMKRCIISIAQAPEYKAAATEYQAIFEEYLQLTQGSLDLQTATYGTLNKPPTADKIKSALQYSLYSHAHEKAILEAHLKRAQDYLANPYDTNISSKAYLIKRREAEVRALQDEIQKHQAATATIEAVLSDPAKMVDLERAAQLRYSLYDDKFEDINANLWHMRTMANQFVMQYGSITRDFASEYPVLSPTDLSNLETGDNTALTNLALTAGAFKPSLTNKGKRSDQEVRDLLVKKYQERQELLRTYNGVRPVTTDHNRYAEDNEVQCRVSQAPAAVTKQITDQIARDWDMSQHGGMRYKIKGVYEVSGLAVDAEFQKIKAAHAGITHGKVGGATMPKKADSDLFYHGTGAMATSLILGHSGGFKVGKAKVGRMLGDGIYLADKSSKSAQYISDSGFARHGMKGSLMIVEASLGRTCAYSDRGQWSQHDSVFASTHHGVKNNEWCVHNPKAVIPRYLVEMEVL